MHEYVLAASILERVRAAAETGDGRVVTVRIAVAASEPGLSTEHLQSHLALLAEGTAMAGADFRILCADDVPPGTVHVLDVDIESEGV